MKNLNITYERDAINSYLVIKVDDSIHIENYEVEMIGRNTIDAFLDFNVRTLNTDKNLYYNITSKQQLIEILERKKLTYEEVKLFLRELIAMIKDCDKYYLNSVKIALDPDMIYVSPNGFLPHFIYMPFSNMEVDILDGLKKLIEYLFDKVDQDDVNAVMIMHKIVTASKQQDYNLRLIEEIIGDSTVKSVKQESSNQEIENSHVDKKDKSYDDYIISRLIEKNKQKEQSIENHDEKKKETQRSPNKKQRQAIEKNKVNNQSTKLDKPKNKSKKLTNYLHYMSIGCIQIITILLFLILLQSKVLYSDLTGKIKMESLFAAVIMLCALDLYVSKKIHDHLMKMKKKDCLNMNKQQVFNQPAMDTFSRSTKNREALFNGDLCDDRDKKGNNDRIQAPSSKSKHELTNDDGIKEPVRKEISYRNHFHNGDYSSDDTQLLEKNNDDLNLELNPYLLSKDGDMINKVLLSNNPFIIGKLEGQVDYIVENSSVSRIHCKIIKEENNYFIIDLNSKNGTYLDDERLVSNEKYPLYDGSHIAISNCEYSFELT